MKLRLALPLLFLLLAGCAGLPKGPGCVKIGPYGAACLLPPSALPEVQAQHVVSIEHDGRKDTFLGRLGIDHEQLRLAGASLFGTHLFSIRWDGTSVSMQPPREAMHPDLVVAMLQAAIADPDILRPRLHGITLSVRQVDGGGEVRELHEHGHLVARVQKDAGPLAAARLVIEMPPAHMRLVLEPVEPN